MIGEVIGSFNIIRFIKSGGMADVYEGQEINIGKKVAIKVLKPNFQNEKDIVNRFYKEGAVLEQLAHPNIVRVLYTTAHHGNPVMIMEYLDGEDLNDYLQENAPLPISVIESFFLQILDAVIYAHSQNVLHRDIKPSNIFITQSKQIKILDFGIAKILDSNSENTQTGFGMYTPSYMSPEQARAEKNLTAQTDVYSLGVTLYTMAAGKNPYQGLSQYEVGNKVLNEPLPNLTNFSDALNKVIAKATEKNKELRYETVKAFKDDFGRALHVKVNENVVIEKEKNEPPVKLPNNEKDNQSKLEEGTNFNSYIKIAGVFSFCVICFIIYTSLNKGGSKPEKATNSGQDTIQQTATIEEDMTEGGTFGTIINGVATDDSISEDLEVNKTDDQKNNESIDKKEEGPKTVPQTNTETKSNPTKDGKKQEFNNDSDNSISVVNEGGYLYSIIGNEVGGGIMYCAKGTELLIYGRFIHDNDYLVVKVNGEKGVMYYSAIKNSSMFNNTYNVN